MPGIRPHIVLLLALATVTCGASLRAGDWHYRTSSGCSDCHTQHNSENDQPMRTDNVIAPAPILLRRATAQELCLSCHDGSQPGAPNVVSEGSGSVDWAGGTFPRIDQSTTPNAHHLGSPTPEIPPGGTIPMVLTCTTCHDPHGNDNYRNLRPDPTRTNLSPLTVVSFQTVTANGTNAPEVYASSKIIYKSGMTAWCGQCHGTPNPAGDHPVDKTIWGSLLASYATWAAVTLPRVPVNSPADNVIPSNDDQVNCLSCHKAHGSTNYASQIYADGVSSTSTCQECHNQ